MLRPKEDWGVSEGDVGVNHPDKVSGAASEGLEEEDRMCLVGLTEAERCCCAPVDDLEHVVLESPAHGVDQSHTFLTVRHNQV